MKTSLRWLTMVTLGLLIGAGCTSAPKTTTKNDLSALQGTWTGQEVGQASGVIKMTVTGQDLKFRATAREEWYEGRLTVRPETTPKQAELLIESCKEPKYNGKIAKALYQLDGNTLLIAANEPGEAARPTTFAPGNQARVILFTRE